MDALQQSDCPTQFVLHDSNMDTKLVPKDKDCTKTKHRDERIQMVYKDWCGKPTSAIMGSRSHGTMKRIYSLVRERPRSDAFTLFNDFYTGNTHVTENGISLTLTHYAHAVQITTV